MRKSLLLVAMVALMASVTSCGPKASTDKPASVTPEPGTVPASEAHMMTETPPPPPPPPPPPAEGETGGANY